MTSEFIAYIDEAGDEGFGKLKSAARSHGQSSWLILGAMLVPADQDFLVPSWKRTILARFPKRKSLDLHWRNLKHDQRVVVSQEIAALPISAALTLSHKVTIPGSRSEATFKRPGYLYNTLIRWLLERLIDWCEQQDPAGRATLRVVFSKRRGTDYAAMRSYLDHVSRGLDVYKSPQNTNWSVLDIKGIEIENHSKRAGLQLSDCITSAFFTALEPNWYGNIETSYAERLIGTLIRDSQGQVRNAGLAVVPGLHAASPNPNQRRFLDRCWAG